MSQQSVVSSKCTSHLICSAMSWGKFWSRSWSFHYSSSLNSATSCTSLLMGNSGGTTWYNAPNLVQFSCHTFVDPLFISHNISCFTSSLASNIFLQTCDPFLNCTTIGISFLQYLFHIKLDQRVLVVLNLHHSLANRAFDTSIRDLKSSPPSFLGRHKFCYLVQCLLLPSALLLQKNLANVLCKCSNTFLGGSSTESICVSILCSTEVINVVFPPYDNNFPFQECSLAFTFWLISL